ncbi:MAG TPA: branched-chain amino acid ABC transporter permease [Firmicutes bacterium]|nr:branched-chain amino acid ABC transporter permease [Bacillota bacterium]
MENLIVQFPIIVQQLISGLAYGCIYGLVALGYNFIWNAVGIVNLAQGDFVMVGAYLYAASFIPAFVKVSWLQGIPTPWAFWIALGLTALAMALVGVVAQRIVYYPLKDAHPRTILLSTVALSIFLKNFAIVAWGTYPIATAGLFGQKWLRFHLFSLGSVTVLYQYLFIFAFTGVLLLLQWLFFNRTTLGKTMRAVAQDRLAASLMGINTPGVIAVTFAYASILAGIAGVLLAPIFLVSQAMSNMGLKAYTASIVGGFGNLFGAVVGGLVVGVIEVLSASYISSIYKDALVFLVLILFLLLRPQGLFGKKVIESL